MANKELAKAIIDSGKKKKTVARLASVEAWELSRFLSGKLPTPKQRERLARVLAKPESEIFPTVQSDEALSA